MADYYNRGSVTVDQNFARFGSKSYAIDKINTVEVRARPKAGMGIAFLFGFLALLTGAAGASDLNLWALAFAAFFSFIAYLSWQRTNTKVYSLFLMTSSSEAQAIETEDQDDIMNLRAAIEAAIVAPSSRAA